MTPTKSGKVMGFGKVEDMHSSIDIVLFPRVYEKYKDIAVVDNIVKVRGRLDIGDRVQINVQDMELWRLEGDEDSETAVEERDRSNDRLYLNFEGISEADQNRALTVLDSYKGDTTVYCQINRKLANPNKKVNVTNQLIWELSAIIGENAIKYVEDVDAKK